MIKPDENPIDYVDDYVHGLLSQEDAELVERYCEKSPVGRAALEEARKRYAAMQAIAPSEAPERLIQRTVKSIELKEIRRTKLMWNLTRVVLFATAASVLVIGGLNLYYYRMKPSPFDVRLLGQSELLAGSRASLRIAVLHRETQRPLAGVPIRIALYHPSDRQEVELARFTTDDRGAATPRFTLPDWNDGEYELRVAASPEGTDELLSQTVQLKRQWQLMVSTDKPVYQPGQTIRLRSLALKKPDLKPVTGEEVTFSITDPKGNVIFKQRDLTSRFGISSADCPLASEIIQGEYRIQCTVSATSSSCSVSVEKYVLPKFKVALMLDKPFYAPGDRVTGSVQADYFFGQPVALGAVKIEARGTDVKQYALAAVEQKTDDKGMAEFSFPLPARLVGREQDAGSARFLLVATVTDTAGQQHSTGTSRIVTSNPIQVEVIPESGTLVRGVDNAVYIFTTYADGRPAQTRLLIQGRSEEVETSGLGIASLQLKPETDYVGLTIRATDSEGRVGRKHVQLTCGSAEGDFLVRPDRAMYTGGETMKLVAMGGGVEPVFVDFIKDGQTILTEQIEMKGGTGRYEFDLPPDLFGTIEICAYRFRGHGLAVRKSRMVFVKQAAQLAINATLDQGEYRPGAKASIKLRLTDSDGKPTPGAFSLKAVDEAVYSVLAQQSGMEQTFFLLEKELLQPIYAIYPGWSPELFTELPVFDRTQFQQAMFSRTAQQVEGAGALPDEFFTGGEEGRGGGGAEPFMMRGEMPALVEAVPEEAPPAHVSERPSPFTLATTSFPEKLRCVNAARDAGLHGVTIAWVVCGGVLVLVGFVVLAVFYLKVAALLAVLGLAGFLFVLLLPAVQAKRISATAMFAEGGAAPEAAMTMDLLRATAPAEVATREEARVGDDSAPAQPTAPPRLRQWFPETLLWRPELITDDKGEATLDMELADSITTWRLSTSAVSAQGQLGGADFPVKVFQPFFVDFNLPPSLTRNDEVGVPVVVYNYLDKPQKVELTLKAADWYRRVGGGEGIAEAAKSESTGKKIADQDNQLTLDLRPGEIRSIRFPLEVLKVGVHQLEVTAMGSGVADAVRREIEVVPDGVAVEQVASGMLSSPFELAMAVPDNAIDGSVRAVVKLYPSTFSQLVEGLDAIFQMPSGCFEQTSSTTYPNVLALDYLRRTGKSAPAVEAKARQYIHVGYQRLVSFEVRGGGFDWFGNPPANRTLTAYGLMEFDDMAKVHDVDPQLTERTRQWLLAQRKPDGSWPNEAGMLNDGLAGSVQRGGNLDLASTAYVAWAVFGSGQESSQAAPTLEFLLAHSPESIDDPYLLAATANAIAGIDKNRSELGRYAARLDALKKASPDGKHAWWEQKADGRTAFFGSGKAGDIETTAMATLALLRCGLSPGTSRAALAWLVEQKDPRGTWHSTQATVLALKALLAGTGAALGGEKERKVDVALGGETVRQIVVPVDQSDVMQQMSLSELLKPGNAYSLKLTDRSDTAVGYQVTFRYFVPSPSDAEKPAKEPLAIQITYDRQRLNVDDTVAAVATVVNNMGEAAPMVILDLPVPGGFAIESGELDELVGSQRIARYQITARKAIVYLRRLEPGESLELRYRLRATMPVKVVVPEAEAYEYYNPARRGKGRATRLEAVES